MKICNDCRNVVIDSPDTFDYHYSEPMASLRWEQCVDGLADMPTGSVGERVDEHSTRPCDCCMTKAHGERYAWIML